MIIIKRNKDSHYRKVMRNLEKKLYKLQGLMDKAFAAGDQEAYSAALLRADAVRDDIDSVQEDWGEPEIWQA